MKTKFILVMVFWVVFFGVTKADTLIDDYKKECDGGNAKRCGLLGYIYYEGQEGVRKDYFVAADLRKKACDGGDAAGCAELGLMYDNGQGVKQNYFTAVDLYKKACDVGHAAGCYKLGYAYTNGQGVKQDYFTSANLFQKACDSGSAMGCVMLGLRYEYGQEGVRKNMQKALKLYGKSCDMKLQNGCDAYAELKNKGR